MTLPLNKEVLAAAYDYLASTEPFAQWNMPHSEDVVFKVSHSREKAYGWYIAGRGEGEPPHEIAVSSKYIGRTQSLMEVMAHEMIHLHQKQTAMHTSTVHNAAFKAIAAKVCALHGFDPLTF